MIITNALTSPLHFFNTLSPYLNPKSMKQTIYILLLLSTLPTFSQSKKEDIIGQYLTHGAYKYHYTLQDWQDQINLGLAQDSTLAVIWPQKALPYWKTKKYTLAVACYDKAVKYDRENYLGRRGYLKCIFQKDYLSTIEDMEQAQKEFDYNYQNDHSYSFYIALCYLQLQEFSKAQEILQRDFDRTTQKQRKTGFTT